MGISWHTLANFSLKIGVGIVERSAPKSTSKLIGTPFIFTVTKNFSVDWLPF